ncbi:MAG: polymer-forming cytoskeletal protein [Desulfonatronovibrio sp. MSAO_Bac4]|nr:MAG: polymer-forming cytoskeletal protein [Desulfonatronovibrio sp. MSAO_Bac4]
MAKDEINAFMGMGTSYQGKLEFKGTVRIDGDFEGEIESDGTLIVGNEATVKGTVRVGQMVLSGKFDGILKAQVKVVLYKQANFLGKITTPALMIEEGAVVRGEINMEEDSVEPQQE